MGANSWMELLPGLSRAPEMINKMKEEHDKELTGKGKYNTIVCSLY